ncbi:hypothetical protein HETIRDRAFT_306947 [Heterobasidion irregulare TC 32-1]|uniref:Uncharacterized protein n=1 Tax=Heterobasidion irregulare (strain TC 32-1) TaxID=747525 RepID=W4KPB6_HETIT|nr:uncharacterized protein HETIRDRAFT_306947 [Heterobasidion irregulare TC 32-1]ETW87683.1 hypothetical protein HETIRDRAFT_306947 [Heterobasidion irregulare TC 32-1]
MEQNDVAFYSHAVFLLRLTDLRFHADSVRKQGSRGLDDESDDLWLGGRT